MSVDQQPHGSWPGRLAGAAGAIRLLGGRPLTTPGAVVLCYHDIGDDPANQTEYYLTPDQLRSQLRWAVQWGLEFVDLHDLVEDFVTGRPLDGLAAIAFDDGLVGVYRHALPILAELGLPATVFAVSGSLGATPPWWDGAARVMTRAELVEVSQAGFRVASHTRTHPRLPGLEAGAVREELAGSRATLEDLAGTPVDLLAYPFGDSGARVQGMAAELGYRAGFSFQNGRLTAASARFRLPRLNMWKGQRRLRLAYHLARPPASWPEGES
jgi:peptidoglycan/xylan/chitin deacetylase (PgdA/CDA1 family)